MILYVTLVVRSCTTGVMVLRWRSIGVKRKLRWCSCDCRIRHLPFAQMGNARGIWFFKCKIDAFAANVLTRRSPYVNFIFIFQRNWLNWKNKVREDRIFFILTIKALTPHGFKPCEQSREPIMENNRKNDINATRQGYIKPASIAF